MDNQWRPSEGNSTVEHNEELLRLKIVFGFGLGHTMHNDHRLSATQKEDDHPARSKGVVFALHGIRTHAGWHRALYEVLNNEQWQVRTDRWAFGYFNVFQFLTPWSRTAKVQWFRKAYDEELKDRSVQLSEREFPSIVAHSFGTYILGNAMLKYDWLRFDKVILCGSILPTDFPWDKLIERGQVQAVRNEFGVDDIWVNLVGWFVSDTGASGRIGFKCEHQRLVQEEFHYEHSEYFDKGHMAAKWLPFLQQTLAEIPRSTLKVGRPRQIHPLGLYFGYAAALLSTILMVVLLRSARHSSDPVDGFGVRNQITLHIGKEDGTVPLDLALIPHGEFLMGREENDTEELLFRDFPGERSDFSRFRHEIYPPVKTRLERPFYMSVMEVTRAQFKAFVDATGYVTEAEKGAFGVNPTGADRIPGAKDWKSPGHRDVRDDHPVTFVSLIDARAFCEWMTKKTKLKTRLPTQEEWEYSCRANQKTPMRYSHTNDALELKGYANLPNRIRETRFQLEVQNSLPSAVPPTDQETESFSGPVTIALPLSASVFEVRDEMPDERDDDWMWQWLGSFSVVAGYKALPQAPPAIEIEIVNKSSRRLRVRGDENVALEIKPNGRLRILPEKQYPPSTRVIGIRTNPPFLSKEGQWAMHNAVEGGELQFFTTDGKYWSMTSLWRRTDMLTPGSFVVANFGDGMIEFLDESGQWIEVQPNNLEQVSGVYAGITSEVPWDDSYPELAPVGSYKRNAFGLADMHGNVWEWCDSQYEGPLSPSEKPGMLRYILRGGCYM